MGVEQRTDSLGKIYGCDSNQSGDGPQAKQLKQKILTTMDTHTHIYTHIHMLSH